MQILFYIDNQKMYLYWVLSAMTYAHMHLYLTFFYTIFYFAFLHLLYCTILAMMLHKYNIHFYPFHSSIIYSSCLWVYSILHVVVNVNLLNWWLIEFPLHGNITLSMIHGMQHFYRKLCRVIFDVNSYDNNGWWQLKLKQCNSTKHFMQINI